MHVKAVNVGADTGYTKIVDVLAMNLRECVCMCVCVRACLRAWTHHLGVNKYFLVIRQLLGWDEIVLNAEKVGL